MDALREKTSSLDSERHVERNSANPKSSTKDEVVGKTPDGTVFRVPTTHDVLTLLNPCYPKSHFDVLNLALLTLQLVIFFRLPRHVSKQVFFVYFIFWRAAYDGGLGWILTRQSKRKWIVREIQRLGWLDEHRRPAIRNWIKAQLDGKMGKDYFFDDLPIEYNAWLLFRQVVDVILLNDFLSYCMFAFSCFRVPEGLPVLVHLMRWIGGIALIAFNLWVKTEAHNVVKDYGWYWGDCFFQRGALVFDGVFELAPHPMYSVGYAGYYGLSLISGSYPVLFVSLAAHAAQFAFLVLFENPHIERLYGQRRPIAQRIPLVTPSTRKSRSRTDPSKACSTPKEDSYEILPTPAATEGESATETDLETEVDVDFEVNRKKTISPVPSCTSSTTLESSRVRTVSRHDLFNQYFRRDTVLLMKLDLLRTNDFMLLLIITYTVIFVLLPPLSYRATLALHSIHALFWIIFQTFGLGVLLRAQSKSKFLVRHFLKHYYYPENDGGSGAIQEAFANWKSLYNLSMCMTYTSFIGLVWKTYSIPREWSVGNELLRHTLGFLLVGLHIWATVESFEVLGVFGWFFGDFFMEDFPANIEYSGIYRYLNNPEVMSGAAFFGLALVSNSKLVVTLAIIRHLSQWWFLSRVENPHMRKLYGVSLRKEAGFIKVIKEVATKNARRLESRAGRHGPRIRRVAKEVKVTFDKAIGETTEAVEDFLAKSRPKLTEVMEDTKDLLKQSREKLVIRRVTYDMPSYDTTGYRITIAAENLKPRRRFHLGEPIAVQWHAPSHHSRRDWIGIYKVGVNKLKSATRTSSLGMWVPVHDDEWDGDFPLHLNEAESPEHKCNGHVVFRGEALPWQAGRYEIRYHHDGKYDVMSLDGPIEIYVDRPAANDFSSVRERLMQIVTLCLDSDPFLIPHSAQLTGTADSKIGIMDVDAVEGRDPDDFRFWSERQAKRICEGIRLAFDVEYAPEVVIAHANLSALTNRILLSKEILTTKRC